MPVKTATGYRWNNTTLELFLYIQPNAKRQGYNGFHDDKIKFSVSAPAIEGKANKQLVTLLAKLFAVPKGSVTIVRGNESRHKQVLIELPQKIPEWIASPEQPV